MCAHRCRSTPTLCRYHMEVVCCNNPQLFVFLQILVNVAPKKPNWDLRRDVAPKLAKLDRLTQQALLKLAREEASARAEDEKES